MCAFEKYVESLKAGTASRFYRKEAIWELGRLGDERAVGPLSSALQDKDEQVRIEAARALARLGSFLAVEPLIAALQDEDKRVRGEAAEALAKLGSSLAVEPLIAALQDEDTVVQRDIINALGEVGDARAIEPLKQIQEGQSSFKPSVEYSLQRIEERLKEPTPAEVKPIAEISQEAGDAQLKGGGTLERGTPTPESDHPKEVCGTSQEAKVEDQQETEEPSSACEEKQGGVEFTEPTHDMSVEHQHAEHVVSGMFFLLQQKLTAMVDAENKRFDESAESVSDIRSKYKEQEEFFGKLKKGSEQLDQAIGNAVVELEEEAFKKAFEGVEPADNSYRMVEACLKSLRGMSRVNIGEFAKRVGADQAEIDEEWNQGEQALNDLRKRFQQSREQANIEELSPDKLRQIAESFARTLSADVMSDLPDPLERERFYSNPVNSIISFLCEQLKENINDGLSELDIVRDAISEMHSLNNQAADALTGLGKRCDKVLSLAKDRLGLIIPQFNSFDELLSTSKKIDEIKDQEELDEDASLFAGKLILAFEKVDEAMVGFREEVGISRISPEVGALVDYKKHKPIEAKEHEDKEEGIILEVNQPGYELDFDGSILQIASVTIAKKPRPNS